MASKIKELKKIVEERGDLIGSLLPANWIELNGKFSPEELKIILMAVENNFTKANGSKK